MVEDARPIRVSYLEALRQKTPLMLDALSALVEAESPSREPVAIKACADVVADIGEKLLGTAPEFAQTEDRVHLHWKYPGERPIVLIGHFDTVWPLGTTARWPFSVNGDKANGPGTFDMKAGLVQGLFAVAELEDRTGIEIICNSDEEIGSVTSEPLIEEAARRASAALILEPSEKGALKIARKGVQGHDIEIVGRAAHAGLEPAKGINAVVELAHQILAIEDIARPEEGTTVTPTVASAGTASNTVPAAARVHIDVRALSLEELKRVQNELEAMACKIPGATLTVRSTRPRSPLPSSASTDLFGVAVGIGERLGMGRLNGVTVGGGSDGNLTAGVGTPTLDGLGAVGSGAHAEGEHVVVSAMAERAALVAELIQELRRRT